MHHSLLLRALPVIALITVAMPASAQNAVADIATVAERTTAEIAVLPPVPAQQARGGVLYDNGPLVNSPGTGPAGEDESILQTALTLTLFGFGHNTAPGTNIRVADDFEVPAGGWDIDEIQFYGYQTGSSTTSTFTTYVVQIWDGLPGDPGSTVVFGDTTTNRLSNSEFANILRRTDTSPGNVMRPVMQNTTTVDVNLDAGTYWVEWGATGSLASGPWVPPITINGQTTTGNARQVIGGVWQDALDGTFPQGLPFIIMGTPLVAVEDGPSIAGEFALAAPAPNPSSSAASVTVEVERAQAISVVVYDVVGRAVATLHDGLAPVGTLRLTLDSGSLPAGAYLLRAAGEAGTVSQRMTIAR
jgi:hypothetical protein